MNILMVAPPGAGKGTQAQALAEHYGIEHLASGDLLRAELAADTEIGRAANEYVRRGDLVPDDLVMRLVLDRVVTAARSGGYILDGFPRNRDQAAAAYEMAQTTKELALDAVVHLVVQREELRRRILARAAEEDRSDDRASVVERRLRVYDEQTEPLLHYYRDRGILVSIDGGRAVDAVTKDLIDTLDGLSRP